jgi:hypothetical protein
MCTSLCKEKAKVTNWAIQCTDIDVNFTKIFELVIKMLENKVTVSANMYTVQYVCEY